jgi:hypothetical protein
MSNPRILASVQLPNATPVVVDVSNFDKTLTIGITAAIGTDVVKCEGSLTYNAGGAPAQANWFPIVATGLTAGSTAAGASLYFSTTTAFTAFRFTRTAGTGVDTVEVCA